MPFVRVCKTESDNMVHLPKDDDLSKTLCGKDAIDPHDAGRQEGPNYSSNQLCRECSDLTQKAHRAIPELPPIKPID